MIDIPEVPILKDGSFELDEAATAAVNLYVVHLAIQVLEDPFQAVPEFLRLHDRYGDTIPLFVQGVAMSVAGRITDHMLTRAEQSEMAALAGKLIYFIDGAKAVLSQTS